MSAERERKLISAPVPELCSQAVVDMSPAARITAFAKIWEENKDRIAMPRLTNYPMNYRAGLRWARRHCDPDSIKFAEMLIQNTLYVSFGEFSAALKHICASFCAHYAHKRDTTAFVLILPFDTMKSNFWVSLLAWPWLRNIVTDIDFSITGVYNRYAAGPDAQPVVCIVCDDCAYTGNQIMSYCTLRPADLAYPNKPQEPSPRSFEWIKWNTTVAAAATSIETALDPNTFAIALLIPYMSSHAQSNIAARHHMLAPKDVRIFQLFRERAPIHEFNQSAVREFESTFQYHSSVSAIYFDHKVADAVSTFNKIYLLAPIFGCGNLRASVCFIDGCCNAHTIPSDLNIYDVHMNLEDILHSAACPPTFYKSIAYTLKGATLGQECIQNVIEGRASGRTDKSSKQPLRRQRGRAK